MIWLSVILGMVAVAIPVMVSIRVSRAVQRGTETRSTVVVTADTSQARAELKSLADTVAALEARVGNINSEPKR